jgi:hypothetical protein
LRFLAVAPRQAVKQPDRFAAGLLGMIKAFFF